MWLITCLPEKNPLCSCHVLLPTRLEVIQGTEGGNSFLRACLILSNIRMMQPTREFLYYIGGTHHSLILKVANFYLPKPFKIIAYVPKEGIRGYAKAARKFAPMIDHLEADSSRYDEIRAQLPVIDLHKFMKHDKGRYSHKPFWKTILISELVNRRIMQFKESKIDIASDRAIHQGFLKYYPEISALVNA